jgi:hypothetical protein
MCHSWPSNTLPINDEVMNGFDDRSKSLCSCRYGYERVVGGEARLEGKRDGLIHPSSSSSYLLSPLSFLPSILHLWSQNVGVGLGAALWNSQRWWGLLGVFLSPTTRFTLRAVCGAWVCWVGICAYLNGYYNYTHIRSIICDEMRSCMESRSIVRDKMWCYTHMRSFVHDGMIIYTQMRRIIHDEMKSIVSDKMCSYTQMRSIVHDKMKIYTYTRSIIHDEMRSIVHDEIEIFQYLHWANPISICIF